MTHPIEFPAAFNRWAASCFLHFLQLMMNRYVAGHFRYGKIARRKRYLSRLKEEIRTYEQTGNMENLINAAVYCFLESEAPENENFHFNATVDSATRREFGV